MRILASLSLFLLRRRTRARAERLARTLSHTLGTLLGTNAELEAHLFGREDRLGSTRASESTSGLPR